jgi:predicted dehydrogenase
MTPNTINLAVIGAGEWAQLYHLPAIKYLQKEHSLQITGIWNRTAEKAQTAARRFGIPRVYAGLDDMLADQDINCFAVVVHADALKDVLDKVLVRNLPVLTEKPPGKNYEEAEAFSQAVKVTNVVAFNRRYTPLNQQFKQIVRQMPGLYFAECHFYRHQRYIADFITETGIHAINYMEYLLGRARTVSTEKWKNPENDTNIWISRIVFESGVKGVIKFFPCSGSSVERYEVHSNDISAYLHSPQHYTEDIPGRIIVHKNSKVHQIIEGSEADDPLVVSGFVGEYRDFFDAILHNKATVSNFQNASHSMQLAEAIEKGGRLVR